MVTIFSYAAYVLVGFFMLSILYCFIRIIIDYFRFKRTNKLKA